MYLFIYFVTSASTLNNSHYENYSIFFYNQFCLHCWIFSKKENVIKIDSTKTLYELIVIDPGFDSWYELKKSPANYKMEEYYKHWNQRYSIEWNILFRRGDKNVDSDIDYRIDIDYGFEFQHKLYFYFKFW